jgi:UDP-N-acetylmuramate dehydrogenase
MADLDALVASGVLRTMVSVAALTTYKLGGPARYYLEVDDEDQLVALGDALGDEPVLVLGRGSNLIISDEGFPGLVVHLGDGFVGTVFGEQETVTCGAGTSMPSVARACARAARGGLEFFIGIPGSIGGGVRMNAGCHGSEIKEWLRSARVVDLRSGTLSERTPDELDMSYRHSNLGSEEVVTGATFRTETRDPEAVAERMRDIVRWRRDHQPGGTLNAGSVFKNPPGDSAGRIIDSLGLKGTRVGGAEVSAKHANFFVASDGVKAQDVYDLVWAIRNRVAAELGIWLQPEVKFAGPFRLAPDEVTQ